ncbi:MAG: type II secretion system F family protein [Pseudomonadota bacterium]
MDVGKERLKLEINSNLSDNALSEFSSDLRSMIATGVSLPRALSALADSNHGGSRLSLARDLKLQMELGGEASQVLLQSKSNSAQLLGRFLRAAELGGRYESMLQIASDFLTQRAKALSQIRSALAYPIFLSVVSILALSFLVIYVTPAIAPLFEDGEAPVVISASAVVGNWVQSHARLSLLALACLVGVVYAAVKNSATRSFVSRRFTALPVIKPISEDLDFGPLALAYGALLEAGWPTEQALRLSADLSNGPAADTFRRTAMAIRDGATLSDGFAREKSMPIDIVRAIEIGEASGTVPKTMSRTGDYLIRRALRNLERMSSVLGPLLIVSIGAVVAWLMITLLASLSALGDAAV